MIKGDQDECNIYTFTEILTILYIIAALRFLNGIDMKSTLFQLDKKKYQIDCQNSHLQVNKVYIQYHPLKTIQINYDSMEPDPITYIKCNLMRLTRIFYYILKFSLCNSQADSVHQNSPNQQQPGSPWLQFQAIKRILLVFCTLIPHL